MFLIWDAVDFPLLPDANRFCGCFVWALAPFCFGVFLLFVSLFPLAKRKSGWGICGSSLWLLVLCFATIDLLMSRTVRPCTDVFTAYSHVRTEPLVRHRPNSREKNTCKCALDQDLSTAMVETKNGTEKEGVHLSSLRTDTPRTNFFCLE